jgi:hypothetical protein
MIKSYINEAVYIHSFCQAMEYGGKRHEFWCMIHRNAAKRIGLKTLI